MSRSGHSEQVIPMRISICTLLHESDKALEYLISYFQSVDDPVEIVFFGDHQPSLNTNFYKGLNGKGLSGLTEDELENLYTVPFFIWTNYETETEEVPITSLNYLSTMALERAGDRTSVLQSVFWRICSRRFLQSIRGDTILFPVAGLSIWKRQWEKRLSGSIGIRFCSITICSTKRSRVGFSFHI